MESNVLSTPSVIGEVKAIIKTAWGLFTTHKAINFGFLILLTALFFIAFQFESRSECSSVAVDCVRNIAISGKLISYLIVIPSLTLALPHLLLAFLYCEIVNLFKVRAIVFLTYNVAFLVLTSLVLP